jgi:peptidoglycan hydrolase CwlO-like protein|tara:strand:- start:1140 stop:1508 length:369 start_codon:yes stop_codon:yes gene_type:complete
MEWLENKTTQFIALVSIIGTLAGFGYTGATYVNRLENLEAQAEQVSETDDGLGEIEKRIEALETSISYLNKTIDETVLIKIDSQSDKIEAIKSEVSGMKADIENVKSNIKQIKDQNKNPLAG